jgi:hypothetical protein
MTMLDDLREQASDPDFFADDDSFAYKDAKECNGSVDGLRDGFFHVAGYRKSLPPLYLTLVFRELLHARKAEASC